MIGTTFKLGFDGTSVSRGLGRITSTIGRGLGRIGIGALERAGHRVTDLMGRLVMAIPDTIKETADWAGGLTDMATATGMSVKDLVILEEKFRLAGVSAKESGAVMSRFALNLQTAATEGGAAAEALRELGFNGQSFVDVPLDEAFKQIAQWIPTAKNAEKIMGDLFGQKLGYQQLKLFRDWDAVTAQAINNVGKLAEAMDKGQAASLDRWADSLGRFENFKRSLATIALDEWFKLSGGAGMTDKFFDEFDPESLRPKIAAMMETVKSMFSDPSKFFGDAFRNLGKSIGDGIKDSLRGSISVKDLFFSKPKEGGKTTDSETANELKKQTALLRRISTQENVATFA